MKKSFIVALACSFFATGAVNAQTATYYGGKNGTFALSIGADPVIDFVGNMFNGSTENYLNGLGGTLAGKYYVSDKFAVAAELGIDNMKSTSFTYNPEDEDYKEVIRKETDGNKLFSLGLGAQYYLCPGKRLQPFVGASIYYGRSNINYEFDQSFEAEWEEEIYPGRTEKFETYDGYNKQSSPVNTFAAMANVGVEYFLKPNISLSATLDLGLSTSSHKEISKYDTDNGDVKKEEIESKNYSYKTHKSTYFATGMRGGKLAFNFYF